MITKSHVASRVTTTTSVTTTTDNVKTETTPTPKSKTRTTKHQHPHSKPLPERRKCIHTYVREIPICVPCHSPGFENTLCGIDGHLYRPARKKGYWLRVAEYYVRTHPLKSQSTYHQVRICSEKNEHSNNLGRVILEAWIGPPPPDMIRPCCNHIDHDTRNNSIENLEWVPLSYNTHTRKGSRHFTTERYNPNN